MAFVPVTRVPRAGLAARVADMGLIFGGLAVPFLILAAGAPIALAIAGLLWLVARVAG